MADPYIGEIRIVAFNFAPRGFALCEGQILPVAQNQALFALIGATYGGDGRTTFALPDLRGRIPLGMGTGPGLPTYQWGQRLGTPSQTLTALNLTPHSHTISTNVQAPVNIDIPANTAEGDTATPGSDKILAKTTKGLTSTQSYTSATADTTLKPIATTLSFPLQATTTQTGQGEPFSIQQPSLAISFAIALEGEFPSRS